MTIDLSDPNKDYEDVMREVLVKAYGKDFVENLRINPMNVTLGGDAAHVLEKDKSSASVYAFQIIPLDYEIEPTVTNLTFVPAGSSPDKIPIIYSNISKALSKLNVIVKFKATDGDTKFDNVHTSLYNDKIRDNIINGKSFEEIRGDYSSVNEKNSFLRGTFDLFIFHITNIEKYGTNKYFPAKYRSPAVGTLFGDKVFLTRCINTCVALGVALIMKIPHLGMETISTHSLECYFGYMRLVSYFVHSKANSIKAAVRSILLRKYMRELNVTRSIAKRDNIGGIHIDLIAGSPVCKKKESKMHTDMPFIPTQLGFFIKDLLIGIENTGTINYRETVIPSNKFIIENLSKEAIPNPSRLAGTQPHERNVILSRLITSMPIANTVDPNAVTPFTFFEKHQKTTKILLNGLLE